MRRITTGKMLTNSVIKVVIASIMTIAVCAGTLITAQAASDPIRIVVLPFYSEEGRDAKDAGYTATHYRRMMRFINNQLVRHNFEVINPFAADSAEREYNRIMERAREDSSLASLEMCKKYGTDAAYIVWLKVKTKKTADGYCKASARVDGEGYDSASRDLGVGLSKTFKVTRRECDDAIAEVEKEVGDLVGRKLTAWSGGPAPSAAVVPAPAPAPAPVTATAATVVPVTTAPAATGGALAKNIKKQEQMINIRLDGATETEIAEVFGKVLNTVTGVVLAKRFSSQIVPDNPQASYQIWRVTIDNTTEPFRLQANISKMINDISDAGGTLTLKGVPYRYTAAEVDFLKGIRPGSTTTRSIQFIVDRELARDREFSKRHDAYEARKKNAGGFE